MKRRLLGVIAAVSMLCSSLTAFAGEPKEELLRGEGFIGETNIKNDRVRELTDTDGREVTTRGEEGKIKVIISGRVTGCTLTIGAVDYLAGRLGDRAGVEIITRDVDGRTSEELKQMMSESPFAWMFGNYDKAHITGDYNANNDMWHVINILKINAGTLPLVIVVDQENNIRYCSMSKSQDTLAPLADYVEKLLEEMAETQPDEPEPDKPEPDEPDEPEPDQPGTFSDVKYEPGSWRYDSVKYVCDRGIMNGIGGTDKFEPDGNLTRGMFATVLYRMAGGPAVEFENKFLDVEAGKYYSNAVIWANKKGIVDGLDGGTRFGVEEFITREQIAKMLKEYARVCSYNTSEKADLSEFPDVSDVSGWAMGYMQWAVGCGMIGGKNIDGTYYLDPKGNATRVECAAMLMRFMKKYQ